jgi:NTP pyrophosphatase (non-canonical NTP hydrolase)
MATDFESIKQVLREFVADRQWERFHEPKDLALAIGIESGELSEHFLWKTVDEGRDYVQDPEQLSNVLDEIADVMIYCVNFVNALERITGSTIDIPEVILGKIEKNARKYPAGESSDRFT